MSIRPAAVAGQFYEADPSRLLSDINRLIESSKQSSIRPKALIVPHAGYIYSGSTAALAYRSLNNRRSTIKRVVLLGPAHRVYVRGMAIPSVDAFQTPLGNIKLDKSTMQEITDMPGVLVSDEAHAQEHSIEVHLPFLQALLDDFILLPIVVGECDAVTVANLLDSIWSTPETLIVISSDLSHFHDYETAQAIDAQTCQRILNRNTDLRGDEACGARAINGLMQSRHAQSLKVELLSACNSGDTAGSRDRVVGYGSFLLH